jgi:hypothetical protein
MECGEELGDLWVVLGWESELFSLILSITRNS